MLEAYLTLLELGYYEAKFAFEGLADENVWKRPTEGLLSVGELAGHIAYWEAIKFAGDGEAGYWEAVKFAGAGDDTAVDLTRCKVRSPLVDNRFRYYTTNIGNPPSEQELPLTAEQVWSELSRVHEESMALFKATNPDLEARVPGLPQGWNYGEFLKYAVFHASYHVGQMFSARHLLGETPPDN